LQSQDLDDVYEDADYQGEEDAPFVDDEDRVLKPKTRGRRKRINNGGHHQVKSSFAKFISFSL
jgi:hypothetical protein